MSRLLLTLRSLAFNAAAVILFCAVTNISAAQELRLSYQQVALQVSDLARSTDFYSRLFGLEPKLESMAAEFYLGANVSFLLLQAPPATLPKIAWIGLAVENQDSGEEDRRVSSAELEALLRRAGLSEGPVPQSIGLSAASTYWSDSVGSAEALFFADGEGIPFRLLLDSCRACSSQPAGNGAITALGINHFTNFVSDAPRSNALMQELFGLGILSYQGPTAPTLSLGDGRQFLMYFGAGDPQQPEAAGRTDHVSLAVADFDVAALQSRLERLGIQAGSGARPPQPLRHWLSMRMANRGGAQDGTPELYFSDPDGIAIQLQDPSYCGGSGYLGDECPPLN